MRQERLKILSLLEEGKITAEEAAKLLEAIKSPEDPGFFSEETAEQVNEKVSRFAKNVEGFARDFGERVGDAYKDIEPKLKKASQAVLERTAAVFDEISRSLNESLENARAKAEAAAKEAGCCCEDDKPKEN